MAQFFQVNGRDNPLIASDLQDEMQEQRFWQFEAGKDVPVEQLICWLDGDDQGDILAYAVIDQGDGIHFFETRYHNCGHGAQIIRALQAERSNLHIAGDIDNEDCRRFWQRMGFDVAGVAVVAE